MRAIHLLLTAALTILAVLPLLNGCTEPNPDAPTGSEGPIYSGPPAPDWHHPDSLCYVCHGGQHGGRWEAPADCLDCHEVPQGPPIPQIPHGDMPDYSCTDLGCHAGIHGGDHSDEECLACHYY